MGQEQKTKKSKNSLGDIFLFGITKESIFVIALAFAINLLGCYVTYRMRLPLWLDVVGTMLASMLYGPIAGSVVAFFTSFFLMIFRDEILFFLAVSITMAFLTGCFCRKQDPKDYFRYATVAMMCGVVSALISLPINLRYFDGYTGNVWGDALYDMMKQMSSNSVFRALSAEAFIDIPDRIFSMMIVTFLISRLRHLKQRKSRKIKTAISAFLLLFTLFQTASFKTVYAKDESTFGATDFTSEYDVVTYGSEDGIAASEVNAVAQTYDGYIWVGTYSGLYKYDGVRFCEADVDRRIKNVMALYNDMQGRLWIGTNDSGVFCMDRMTGEVRVYNTDNGLGSDSVRAIGEDANGNIFIGTVLATSKITPDGEIKTYTDIDDLNFVRSFAKTEDGSMVGVTNNGKLFLFRDDIILDSKEYQKTEGIDYRAVAVGAKQILVGTSEDVVECYHIKDDGFVYDRMYRLPDTSFANSIFYSDMLEGFFYCCENGMGFLDEHTGDKFNMRRKDFEGAVSSACVDNQGNIWFASTKHGLMKYSRTPFKNMFSRSGMKKDVVNAVLEKDGELYIGSDSGLHVISLETEEEIEKPYLEELSGVRIRNIMEDSRGQIWISTYGKNGIYYIDNKQELQYSRKEDQELWGGRCRTSLELSDGRILVATNVGLFFLRDGVVEDKIDEENGLSNEYILSLVECDDGLILAASDGDGIYIIKGNRVVGHIGKEEGLNSLVVLRIVPCTGGYIYVTSNALYYDDGGTVRELKNFPSSNNYDVVITEDRKCLITSGTGLYIVPEAKLLEDGEYTCTLLNERWGLTTTFTANSWNSFDGEYLYLCCTDGVRRLSVDDYGNEINSYNLMLESVECGDDIIYSSSRTVEIPASMGRISFHIAVSNYTLTNPLVRYYLEGIPDRGVVCYQNEIQPLVFTNLPGGDYRLHIQILNESTGKAISEKTYRIRKATMFYERIYFLIYLTFVGMIILFYICWLIRVLLRHMSKWKGMQREATTDPMTGLLNKAGAEAALTKACSEQAGFLLMIDLDSFKLVNDLYGHDMGDRILIRFAELLREHTGENDIIGRMGGDEFAGFILDTLDEEAVEQLAKVLNREITKSAKEFMGADMNIPIGTSIGAVRVPVSGTDFDELFKLADKALYVVKQNGKHGYSLYKKGSDSKATEEQEEKNTLAQVKKVIGERNEGKGAYDVNFERMQVIYKYLNRARLEDNQTSGFLRYRLFTKNRSELADELKEVFEDYLVRHLKKHDVVSSYRNEFYVIVNNADAESCRAFGEKLLQEFLASGDYGNLEITVEAESVG